MNIGTKVKTAWGTGTVTELKKVNGYGRTGLKLTRVVAVVTSHARKPSRSKCWLARCPRTMRRRR